MDPMRQAKDEFSYSNLFNLEPLINYQLPVRDDDFDYFEDSSQDESKGGSLGKQSNGTNGTLLGKESKSGSSKNKRRIYDSEEADEDGFLRMHITEDHYRTMLGEHIQKCQRRLKDFSATPASARAGVPAIRIARSTSKTRKSGIEQRGIMHDLVNPSEWPNDNTPKINGNGYNADFLQAHRSDRVFYEPAYLDIGDGITYTIPPTYDNLVDALNLPSFSDISVDEYHLKGTMDLASLAKLMASDKRFACRNRLGMGEPHPQYESLQARLNAPNSTQKFPLKVSDIPSIPEGAAGNIKRSILSESGVLQVYYVKVLEKGDTYEIIERSLPKKPKVIKDPAVIETEEMEKIGKVWVNIVRRDIPKHYRVFSSLQRKQLLDAKKLSESCQREVRMKVSRSLKLIRGAATRTRKLSKDMLLFWKRIDKEMAEIKKREEREMAKALRREQELREAKRQQQRLNFLIQQTELYSHFMQNKPNSQPSEVVPMDEEKPNEMEALGRTDIEPSKEEDTDEAELQKEALKAAQDAVSKQKRLTSAFDSECLRLRQAADSEVPSNENLVAGTSDMDLQTPSTMPITSTVQTPKLFKGSLKEYQLKGLQWLVNCYEQGLNGILADEMGLGKTIQAMAFLAHLAEEKNIWGPFLVVAPASVLNNWADEIGRFCPDLKTLPYWAGLQERTVLRKNINPKRLYRRDASFHILITSYQLLVSDEKYLQRVKWQYMVLDEAQAIKSSTSIRWKTLLGFNCRNRLLLTGTPIQNNMAELWALLHFIMPTLFDSHEQFNEWFSKGIENHAEHGGTLNEHQLNRLHAILKPFMLRRVKKDVVSELTKKTEITVHCKLSSRQQAFYQAIKNKISLAELFDGNRGYLNEKKILNLMNIVIQLRKVCNHPELFERNEGNAYFYFGEIPNPLLPPPFGELEDVHYSGGLNPVTYKIPKLIQREMLHGPENLDSSVQFGLQQESFLKHFNIFSPNNVHHSTYMDGSEKPHCSGAFGFSRLIELSPAEVAFLGTASLMERLLFSLVRYGRQFLEEIHNLLKESVENEVANSIDEEKLGAVSRMLLIPTRPENSFHAWTYWTGHLAIPSEPLVFSHQDRLLSNTRLLHSTQIYFPKTRAPPISVHCSDRNFAYKDMEELHYPWMKRLFIGFARTSDVSGPRKPVSPHPLIQEIDAELPMSDPALKTTYRIFGSCPPMQSFDPSKLLTDSGKLQTLDLLLKRLRAENHRVLLFAQMTKMLNILEDYMNYRKYRYLRLDGSSTIMDRRDMVRDFQHRSDIFVFLLSTRAGGLGINLTAADTVIFYESDWNPTLDLQAMDRAHRLGQTKDVTVYRLICKETVEEKILQRAGQKNAVQQLVMTGKHVQGDLLAPEDVVSLLLDDAQLEQKLREIPPQTKDRQKKKLQTKGILLDAEGDASLEDLENLEGERNAVKSSLDGDNTKSSNKKRNAPSKKQNALKLKNNLKASTESSLSPADDCDDIRNDDPPQRSKRQKRQKRSVNENIEPAYTAAPPSGVLEQRQYGSLHDLDSGGTSSNNMFT
ncbi:hypothetical protein SAY87_023942 [Trapa incisa]|uniref:Chromatin-remodeling ATPase INO80 n=1 Tax=Trapa incisa TaxID=236973 RepID=A0AAN7QSM3_9MYRT|nr:hypothetical protein SAY87_023942 [Trapa incisa]